MRQLIGSLLVVGGICLGLYIGIWWGFVGGIVAAVEAFKAPEVIPYDVAAAIARIFFCQFLGFAAGVLPVLVGAAMCQD